MAIAFKPMLAAILTAVLFACSGVCGQRSASALGPLRANAIRLAMAATALGLVAGLFFPFPLHSPAIPWLVVSGAIGFGAGDIALFLAYPRLGARLTLLINLCTAPVFGAFGEWALLGDRPAAAQGASCLVILAGVAIALSGQARLPRDMSRRIGRGVLAALGAGAGQGLGATFTRIAKSNAAIAGDQFTGMSEAFVRVVPGFALALLVWWGASRLLPRPSNEAPSGRATQRRPSTLWVAGAALFGPVLGVSCFQWALGQATSGVVLSITATTPILVLPMVAYMDKDRPPWTAVLGSLIAVAGVVLVLAFD